MNNTVVRRAVLLVLFAGPVAPYVRAQVTNGTDARPKPPRIENGQIMLDKMGMDCFRHLLFVGGFDPISNVFDAYSQPENTLIILTGPESIELIRNPDLVNAVRRGASLLVASDRAALTSFDFGIEYLEGTVQAAPDDCFQGKPDYLFVRPIKPLFGADKSPARAVFAEFDSHGVNAIATNVPCLLRPFRRTLDFRPETLAGYPFSARLSHRKYDAGRDFFAIGGTFGDGRAMFLGDHSVFVNNLILRDDIANQNFTRNCVDWLQGPERKKRCLFVEDGVIKTVFPLPTLPAPPDNLLEWILKGAILFEKHGDALMAEQEKRDLFNQMILQRFKLREITRAVLIGLVGFLVLLGMSWLLRSRARSDPARTLVTPELAALIPQGDILRQRFDGLLAAGNVNEAARDAVRDFFRGLNAEPTNTGQMPRLLIDDKHNNSSALRQRIARLWSIGFGSQPIEVKPDDWKNLSGDLKEILEEADTGSWKFVSQQQP